MTKYDDLNTLNMLKSSNDPACSYGFRVTVDFKSCINVYAKLVSLPFEPDFIIDMKCFFSCSHFYNLIMGLLPDT